MAETGNNATATVGTERGDEWPAVTFPPVVGQRHTPETEMRGPGNRLQGSVTLRGPQMARADYGHAEHLTHGVGRYQYKRLLRCRGLTALRADTGCKVS